MMCHCQTVAAPVAVVSVAAWEVLPSEEAVEAGIQTVGVHDRRVAQQTVAKGREHEGGRVAEVRDVCLMMTS